jgi:hypothetical protein
MKTTATTATEPDISAANATETAPAETEVPTASADPDVAEEVGHPVGVGLGALGAGAAGAAIGAVAGPIGIVVGAVIGAIAGGLVGEEVASAGEYATTENPDNTYTLPGLAAPTSLASEDFGHEYIPPSTSGSLYSGSDGGSYAGVDTTPDIPVIPAAEAELIHLQTADQPAHASAAKTEAPVSEEVIRASAYYHYVDRTASGEYGDELTDWLKAERKLS